MLYGDQFKRHLYSSLRSYHSLYGREGEELHCVYVCFSESHIGFGREDYSLQGNSPIADIQFSREL